MTAYNRFLLLLQIIMIFFICIGIYDLCRTYYAGYTLKKYCHSIESVKLLTEVESLAKANSSLRIFVFKGPIQQAVIDSKTRNVFYDCAVVAKDNIVLHTEYMSSSDYLEYIKEFNSEDYGVIPASTSKLQGLTIKRIPTLVKQGIQSDVLVALTSGEEVRASMPGYLNFRQNCKVHMEKSESSDGVISYTVRDFEC